MEKKDLRAFVRAKKRAMTPVQVEAASARLAQQLFRHPAYQAARSLYGYLSYNQEVRTAAILRQAQQDGKLITGQAPGASFAFGLKLLAALRGEQTAADVAEGMVIRG